MISGPAINAVGAHATAPRASKADTSAALAPTNLERVNTFCIEKTRHQLSVKVPRGNHVSVLVATFVVVIIFIFVVVVVVVVVVVIARAY